MNMNIKDKIQQLRDQAEKYIDSGEPGKAIENDILAQWLEELLELREVLAQRLEELVQYRKERLNLICAVGDTVYIKGEAVKVSFIHIDETITYGMIFECKKRCFMCPFCEEAFSLKDEYECLTPGYYQFTADDIGKTVFFSREEYEKQQEEK